MGLRRLNELHGNPGKLDSRELRVTQEITIIARKNGLKPLTVKMGFGAHNPTLTTESGSQWLAQRDEGKWTLFEVDGDCVIKE